MVRRLAVGSIDWLGVAVITGDLEVWILDDTQDVTERIENRGDSDALADVLNGCAPSSTERKQTLQSCARVRHAPINDDTARTRRYRGAIGIEAEFVAANAEADVKRLVEIGRNP